MAEPESSAGDTTPHEFIDAELAIEGLRTPADERKLSDALAKLEGIRSAALTGGKLTLEYEPLRVTMAELAETIAGAGYRIGHTESGTASVIGDAVRTAAAGEAAG